MEEEIEQGLDFDMNDSGEDVGYMAELSKRLYVISVHFSMGGTDIKDYSFSFK
jgi:hypothetical protein